MESEEQFCDNFLRSVVIPLLLGTAAAGEQTSRLKINIATCGSSSRPTLMTPGRYGSLERGACGNRHMGIQVLL